MEGLKWVLCFLEKRLTQHDDNRKEVQHELEEATSKALSDVDLLEENINKDINNLFNPVEEHVFDLFEQFNNASSQNDENELSSLIEKARKELSSEYKCSINQLELTKTFVDGYALSSSVIQNDKYNDLNDVKEIACKLKEHLAKNSETKTDLQNQIAEICNKRREKIAEIKTKINEDFEAKFHREDARIQGILKIVKENIDNENVHETEIIKAQAEMALVVNQKYSLTDLSTLVKAVIKDPYELKISKETSLESFNFEARKPLNLKVMYIDNGFISVSFSIFSNEEINALKHLDLKMDIELKIYEKGSEDDASNVYKKQYICGSLKTDFNIFSLLSSTTYCVQISLNSKGLCTQNSDIIEFKMPSFTESVWRVCPEYVSKGSRYSVDKCKRCKVATFDGHVFGTVLGNMTLPFDSLISWDVNILQSRNNGNGIFVGIAPFDIDQNDSNNYKKYGWYINCCDLTLISGPPHKYIDKPYMPKKLFKKAVTITTGDSIGVLMDTTKYELSFIIKNNNYGVAYENIPCDKPLIPCVVLQWDKDSVELNVLKSKNNGTDPSIPKIKNVVVENGSTWDSISLSWDPPTKKVSYQIEVDGKSFLYSSPINSFTKVGLKVNSEHKFRIRSVKNGSLSEWSEVFKGRTENASFERSGWKECPENANRINTKEHKYLVNSLNSRIVKNISNGKVIGNTPIPLNKLSSWNIKILKSWDNDCDGISIGVSLFDVIPFENNREEKGWYFGCCESSFFYNPENGDFRQHVHTGDTVNVIMDTTNGNLSFGLNGVNYGVEYENIPLDKPLAPCVFLRYKGDSVELSFSEMKEKVINDSVPTNLVANSDTSNSISISWDPIRSVSIYQVNIDDSKTIYSVESNSFIKRGCTPNTEYKIKVRSVKSGTVSKWSDIVKCTTKGESFESSAWKECPECVYAKYSIDPNNPRIATNTGSIESCTIIGDTAIPVNKVTYWNVKILKGKFMGGYNFGCFIGVAPFNINQDSDYNQFECGLYYDCFTRSLFSDDSHCISEKFGKENEGPVVEGDVVGLVMDTTKGELSYIFKGKNYGVAFEGIPLDKPLVPCVLLKCIEDSVELII